MRYKVNNKYVVDAKSHDEAIRVIKMLDAMETYSIRWIDTYAKSKGNKRDVYKHTVEFEAENIKEALEMLAKQLRRDGFPIKNCTVISVLSPRWRHTYVAPLDKLLSKPTEHFPDSVKVPDSVKDGKYVSELKPGDVITKKDGSKWNVVLVRHTPFGIQVRINSKTSPVKTEEITYRPTDMLAYDSCKDAESEADVDLDFLIKDEIEAIDGYRKMIAKTSNPQLLSVLSHILDEETEHVEELRAAQAGVYEVEDD